MLPEIGWVFNRPKPQKDAYRSVWGGGVGPGNSVYIKGGPGLANGKVGDLDWSLEVGVRFLW